MSRGYGRIERAILDALREAHQEDRQSMKKVGSPDGDLQRQLDRDHPDSKVSAERLVDLVVMLGSYEPGTRTIAEIVIFLIRRGVVPSFSRAAEFSIRRAARRLEDKSEIEAEYKRDDDGRVRVRYRITT